MRHGQRRGFATLDAICQLPEGQPGDILEYLPEADS
ncbi:helix-turn-helix domain-containing protein [Pseudophaeobacter arcticus]